MLDLTIKRLGTTSEYDQAVELQKIYWGDYADTLVPSHMLQSLSNHGGHVLGAKMAQRQVALKQGIRRVTWTFDPLLSPNAHLNIRKLGAVARQYRANYFGLTQQKNLRADRLIVEWRVAERRVAECAQGNTSQLTLRQCLDLKAAIVNRADASGSWLLPAARIHVPNTPLALVEIPSHFRELAAQQPQLAKIWRDHIRGALPLMFNAGYAVTDFVRDNLEGQKRSFYLLSCYDE